MIHIHLIVTAVILLVGAMAAIIICICVDIVPIIKSRASTLASRDSTTKDQARKLKKQLLKSKLVEEARIERAKTDENKNIYESDRARPSLTQSDVNQVQAPPITKSTATSTTATVVVEASNLQEERREVLAAPEGDNSAQQSSAGSSLSQKSESVNKDKETEVAADINERSRVISENKIQNLVPRSPSTHVRSVSVSVHSAMPKSPPRQRNTILRQNKQTDDGSRLSAPSSPNVPRVKLPMVSRSRQEEIEERQNRLETSQVEGKVYSRQSSAFSRSISNSSAATNTVNSHRSIPAGYRNSPGQYSDESYNTTESSDRGTPFDYHDAPWDTKDSFLYSEKASPPCKCCYLDNLESPRKKHDHGCEVEDFSAPLLQKDSSHSYRSDYSNNSDHRTNQYYNVDHHSERYCSNGHRSQQYYSDDYRSKYVSYSSDQRSDRLYCQSENISPTNQRTENYYHAEHNSDHSRSPDRRSLKEFTLQNNSPRKQDCPDNEVIRKHYDNKQSHTYSMPNPKHTRHQHLPSNHHLSNHKIRSPDNRQQQDINHNHQVSPKQEHYNRRHQPIGTSSLHGIGTYQRTSSHSSSSSPSSLSSSSGQRRRRTKLEDIQEVTNLSDDEDAAEKIAENSEKSDSPLHSCVKQPSSPDVKNCRCSENEDDQRRLELKRNFVLDMKAAIEGTVTDCGS